MSQVLEVIDLNRLGLPEPKTIFELGKLIAADDPGTNTRGLNRLTML